MTDDKDLLIEDHEYDGIQELDNNLPTWWLWSFLGAMIFAFLYWLHYSLSGDGKNLDQHLAEDMQRITNLRTSAEQVSGGGVISAADLLALGKTKYQQYCASCHLNDGGGSVGPNLTDKYWIHGDGSQKFIVGIIAQGVLEKGMPAWTGLIKPGEISAIADYVGSLRGTTPAKAKAPQGQLVEEY